MQLWVGISALGVQACMLTLIYSLCQLQNGWGAIRHWGQTGKGQGVGQKESEPLFKEVINYFEKPLWLWSRIEKQNKANLGLGLAFAHMPGSLGSPNDCIVGMG